MYRYRLGFVRIPRTRQCNTKLCMRVLHYFYNIIFLFVAAAINELKKVIVEQLFESNTKYNLLSKAMQLNTSVNSGTRLQC